MTTEQITIRVDTDTAKAFKYSAVEEHQKLELLLNLKLRESLNSSNSLLLKLFL